MKKQISILINLVLVIAVLVSCFLLMGVYDQACNGTDCAAIVFEDEVVGFTTSTQSYGGSDVIALNVDGGAVASVPINVDVTMINSYSAQLVYDISSAAITIDSSFSFGTYISIGSTTNANADTNPVFTAAISVADNTPTGIYEIPIIFSMHNLDANRDFTLSETIYLAVKETPDAPAAPTEESKTADSITLTVLSGGEYSMDGTIWQDSNEFTGLSTYTSYTFYQRLKETETAFMSPASNVAEITTNKTAQNAPAAPMVDSKTANSVTLATLSGVEYSSDGTTWQDSSSFTGLSPYTAYTFYQRLKETATAYASPSSTGTAVTTDKAEQAAPAAPTVASKTADRVTITALPGGEYSRDGVTWQDSNVFAGLSPNTAYAFYQRYKETGDKYPSLASAAASITTSAPADAQPDTGVHIGYPIAIVLMSAAAVAICAVVRKKRL